MSSEIHKQLPVMAFVHMDAWLAWLEDHCRQETGLWVKFAKKGSGVTTITYEQAREGALLYGWIDGTLNKYDEKYYLIRFTPRRKKSIWSQINVALVEGLLAEGRMKPTGIAQVEAAKADGRWDAAYASSSTIEVPDDFLQAIQAKPGASEFFAGMSKANRYAMLFRIHHAKRPETRAKIIEKLAQMLADGKVIH